MSDDEAMNDDVLFMRRMDLWPRGQLGDANTGCIGLRHKESGKLAVLARSPKMRGKYMVFLTDVPTFLGAPVAARFESKVYDGPEAIVKDGWAVD